MGAMPGDIFLLVWTETLLLCSIGGIAGVGFALLFAQGTDILIRRILPYAPGGGLVVIDVKLAALTLVVIVTVGLLSGLYPAWKAGRVRPLQSIRSEQ
jgi:putative ABC transport system permease protein